MLAVGPSGPQYSLLFAWHELVRSPTWAVDTLPSQRVPQKILKKSISLYYLLYFLRTYRTGLDAFSTSGPGVSKQINHFKALKQSGEKFRNRPNQ